MFLGWRHRLKRQRSEKRKNCPLRRHGDESLMPAPKLLNWFCMKHFGLLEHIRGRIKSEKLLNPRVTWSTATLGLGTGLTIIKQEISKGQNDHPISRNNLEEEWN